MSPKRIKIKKIKSTAIVSVMWIWAFFCGTKERFVVAAMVNREQGTRLLLVGWLFLSGQPFVAATHSSEQAHGTHGAAFEIALKAPQNYFQFPPPGKSGGSPALGKVTLLHKK